MNRSLDVSLALLDLRTPLDAHGEVMKYHVYVADVDAPRRADASFHENEPRGGWDLRKGRQR